MKRPSHRESDYERWSQVQKEGLETPGVLPQSAEDPDDETTDAEGVDPDDERWEAFVLDDDDEFDPQPEYGDFWAAD